MSVFARSRILLRTITKHNVFTEQTRVGIGVLCRALCTKGDVSTFRVNGVIGAPFTPYKTNGDVDLDKIEPYVDHLVEYGCTNLFVTGTMGEGLNLSVQERKSVAEKWVQAKSKLSTIILHIGAGNLKDSQELAEHAQSIGVDAISCVSPSYYRPQTEEQLVEYMRQVASHAPDTPFYLYDIDFMTNVYLNIERFFTLANERIPTLRGMKYTSLSFPVLAHCLKHSGGKWDILPGTDDQYLMSLAIGGYTSVLSAYLVPTHQRMHAAFMKGDMDTARMEQDRCLQLSKVRAKYGSGPGAFSVARALLPMMGLDIGPPRLPLTPLPADKMGQLEQDLNEIGFFNWVK